MIECLSITRLLVERIVWVVRGATQLIRNFIVKNQLVCS